MEAVQKLTEALKEAGKVAVLTGAGMSTASGIPDFRSRGGLYDRELNVEAILSESYFHSKPKLFWKYFKEIFGFQQIREVEPNAGHLFLAELEAMGKTVTIITQNVDGLHRKAGSSRVLEVHGSLDQARCPKCHEEYGLKDLLAEEIPRCRKHDVILKPDVVLFEGRVKHMEEAVDAICGCELFIVLGTSLTVYPVKELPNYIRHDRGITKAIINKEPTMMDELFDIVVHEEIVPVLNRVKQTI
ncbi:NAD-dependent protein deacylase [Marinicrinis lubricantis]